MSEKLPKGWVRTTLGEVNVPSRARALPSEAPELPYVGMEHVESQTMRLLGHGEASSLKSSSVRFNKGDVLYGKMRPYLNKVWLAEFDGLCSAEFLVFPKTGGLNSQLFAYRLNSQDFVNFANHQVSGDRPRVDFEKLAKFPYLLAPAAAQERIVAKLDALLSRVAAGEAAARRALDRLKKYRAAVLHAAVTGELTREWRKTHQPKETGARLLKRMLKVRRSRWELRWLTGKLTLYIDCLKKTKLPRSRLSVLEESLRELSSFREEVQNSSSWHGDWEAQWNKFRSIKLELSETAKTQAPKLIGGITRFRRDLTYLQSEDWKSKFYSEAEKPELTELPEMPPAWAWASVDQLAAHEPRSITDGPFGSHLKSSHYTNSGPRVIRLQNIGDGVFVDEVAHISRKHYEFLREHAIYAGDLVIRALGIPAPRACRIPEIGPAIVKADCIRFKVAEEFIDSSFVLFALNAPMTQHRTEKKIHGVGRPRLNLGEIKSIALPVPPQNEQKQIARELERRLTAAERLTSTLNRQIERAQVTRQSLLREAFAGKLVPQNPNDEPASILLERIRAAREAEAKKPKAKPMPKPKSKVVRRPLLDVLRSHKKPISPEQLFREAGFQQEFEASDYRHEVVDDFYEELRTLTGARGPVTERRPNGKTVLLEVKS